MVSPEIKDQLKILLYAFLDHSAVSGQFLEYLGYITLQCNPPNAPKCASMLYAYVDKVKSLKAKGCKRHEGIFFPSAFSD